VGAAWKIGIRFGFLFVFITIFDFLEFPILWELLGIWNMFFFSGFVFITLPHFLEFPILWELLPVIQVKIRKPLQLKHKKTIKTATTRKNSGN